MKTYLVALDDSVRAAHVLAEASELAESTGAKLILFRAIGLPHNLPAEAYAISPDEVIERLREVAVRGLEQLAKTIPSNVPHSTMLAIGVPWQSIVAAAAEMSVALIVIGSHGLSGVDRLLGTTASRVVNHAERSVLVVRSPSS